ncbi:hypothetical protein Pth03_77100 [Planotetraspora thailandica]|uniref:Uncharacterized protein n=1 Tax=Planotetraspora thailandica TaxID=487172 RepID=A0A8J3Y221_9ACTN|nr:hypothetical protein [Planotetraspora thailandica]GII59321.1 hypothetical protein Pth03_77100 [Planotetraspora thailandica]
MVVLGGRYGAVVNELNDRRYARAILGRGRRAGRYGWSRPQTAACREEGRHAA